MTQAESVSKIHKALYPRWYYTGGYIIAEVSEDGTEVILLGYANPDKLESEILIRKVEDSLGFKPKIYWQRIGTSTKVLLEKAEIEQQQVASSPSKSESIKKERTSDLWLSKARQDAEAKARQDIQAVVKFAEDSKRAVESKTTQDIQAVVKFAEDINRKATQNNQAATRSLEDIKKEVYQCFGQVSQGTGQVVASLQQTIIDLWNQDWVDMLLEIISRGINLDKAKDEVIKLQLTYSYEQPIQIADRIIRKKAFYATATGLISGIAPGFTLVVDLGKTMPLLVEMVYQIAVIYGYDLTVSDRKGEILAIFGLALGSDQIVQLGLGFLVKHTPIPSWVIDASTNLIMFQLIGYTASQFYEAKVKEKVNVLTSKQAFTLLEEEIEAYLEKTISQKTTIAKAVDEALSIKKQLALS
ncbi:EcsC family protein [Nostoc sp. UHCC 0252]|uniref:EcsC family protein n=1 Tax=Nostoc sp. UHCC 0252 TaxID=3110241 RepID=UPI002B1ED2D4|nr:EcsC family protein [Nostoc sp. UHCC 0252]MEA5600657.1 EcsC family protein [Nostoc sp. UHCC 0252]